MLAGALSSLPPDHPTALVFIDETRDELYFGVGCLKLRDPDSVLAEFAALRRTHRFDRKLRWSDVGSYSPPFREFVKQTALMVARHPDAEFACVLADLTKIGGIANYGSVAEAYIRLAVPALISIVAEPDELLSVIADHFDTPAGVVVERRIKREANRGKGRLAVVSVQRVASAGTEGLQLADLMLGAIAHEFRNAHSTQADHGKAEISLALLTEGYELTAYHNASGGRRIEGRLTVDILPRQNRRGGRGGRRP